MRDEAERSLVGRAESPFHRRLRARYEALWADAIKGIGRGEIERDPVLEARAPDTRRGMTVIARPSAGVARRATDVLRDLRRLEPDQYFYAGSELHVTVLSLFTASADYEPLFARRADYTAAVDAALMEVHPVQLSFEGITASRASVMIQGWFETNALDIMRERLREELRRQGLSKGVDERYRLETAHMTVLRFRAKLREPERFADRLREVRDRCFGEMTTERFALVEHDWYMSRRVTRVLKSYPASYYSFGSVP